MSLRSLKKIKPASLEFARGVRARNGARIELETKRRAVAQLRAGKKSAREIALALGTYPMYVNRWLRDPRLAPPKGARKARRSPSKTVARKARRS